MANINKKIKIAFKNNFYNRLLEFETNICNRKFSRNELGF